MRGLIVIAMLAACGDSPDPAEIVDCEEPMAWPVSGDGYLLRCARACSLGPSGEPDADGDQFADSCPKTETQRGCQAEQAVRFEGEVFCCKPGFVDGSSDPNAWIVDEGACE